MILRIAFACEEETLDSSMPWVIAATDEYTEDNWGGQIPDFYTEDMKKAVGKGVLIREAFVTVPDDFVVGLFAIPLTNGKNVRPVDAE